MVASAELEEVASSCVCALGVEHELTIDALVHLGNLRQQHLGDTVGARSAFEQAVAASKRKHGDGHIRTVDIQFNLAGECAHAAP